MTARERWELIVVGGGRAGLAAVSEARWAGVETCLVEQAPELNGDPTLANDVRTSGATICTDTAAWGIWGRELAVCTPPGPTRVLAADQVILATGAYARQVAFPGWTLPGVMTAGDARSLLAQGQTPGQRVLVAGYGTWLAAIVGDLRAAGRTPVGVLDAAGRAGRLVVRAEGDSSLQRAVSARVDADWRPRAGTDQVVDADALVLAFGRLPENRLDRLAGCQHAGAEYFSPTTIRDPWMRTSVPGIFVAGDAGGIVGQAIAIEQGRLAGVGAALDSGRLTQPEADRRARPIRRRLAALPVEMGPGRGLYALADADTVICRCEDVTARQIEAVLFDGSLEPGPAIAETRAAMGSCQGRDCASQLAAVISRHFDQPIERVPPITPRPPVVPVLLGALAERPPGIASSTRSDAVGPFLTGARSGRRAPGSASSCRTRCAGTSGFR
ncbi:MAG TPA: FAD-dependent oxidoreductase [Chloroflexota bacterium]|nr:FAD-dependent oxidoreductase [Chloroflexota bacterium]